MTENLQTLVVLIGPPAVGKMTVGRELSRLTGFPLFHNHLSIEAVLPIFGFGDPAFNRLVTKFRQDVIGEAARSELPGLIFTFVWAFSGPGDQKYVEALRDIWEGHGGQVVYAELWSDLETRLERNESESRLAAKSSKRDTVASRKHMLEVEEEYQLSSNGAFPLAPHLLVDNSDLSPLQAAQEIAEHFGLARTNAEP